MIKLRISIHHTCLWERINGIVRQPMCSMLCDTIAEAEIKLIRDAFQRGQVTGSERFRQEVSLRLGIRISNKGPGRPREINK